jgi:hypothetical protein
MEIGQDVHSFLFERGVDGLEFLYDGLMAFSLGLLNDHRGFWALFLDQFAFGNHFCWLESEASYNMLDYIK